MLVPRVRGVLSTKSLGIERVKIDVASTASHHPSIRGSNRIFQSCWCQQTQASFMAHRDHFTHGATQQHNVPAIKKDVFFFGRWDDVHVKQKSHQKKRHLSTLLNLCVTTCCELRFTTFARQQTRSTVHRDVLREWADDVSAILSLRIIC